MNIIYYKQTLFLHTTFNSLFTIHRKTMILHNCTFQDFCVINNIIITITIIIIIIITITIIIIISVI